MNSVCIIPARGGSQRIQRKNIKLFYGKPIIAYSIEFALKSGVFQDVFVSSEDAEIGFIAKQYGAKWLPRQDEYSVDSVGTQEVMQYVLANQIFGFEYACCIYPTAPMICDGHFKRCHWRLLQHESCDYSIPAHLVNGKLEDPGQYYWGRFDAFVNRPSLNRLHGEEWIFKQIIPPETVCDINTPEDWNRAEIMYAKIRGIDIQKTEFF